MAKDDGRIHDFSEFRRESLQYWRVNSHKDGVPIWAEEGRCLECGNPKMQDAISPYQCCRCSIKQMGAEEYHRRKGILEKRLEEFEKRFDSRKSASAQAQKIASDFAEELTIFDK